MDRGARQATVHGVARVRHDLATKLQNYYPCQGGQSTINSLPIQT